MWTFRQSDGWLLDSNGARVAQGYSGRGACKNNPLKQSFPDNGPIPVGSYHPGKPEDSPHLGPFAIPLEPYDSNEMFGRSGFFMHGDSVSHPGQASDGCIILSHPARTLFYAANEDLQVIAGPPNLVTDPEIAT